MKKSKFAMQCLQNNFGITVRLHAPNSWKQLYIPKSEAEKFKKLISPYLDSSMSRKIPLPRNDWGFDAEE